MKICNDNIDKQLSECLSDSNIIKVMHKASKSFTRQLDEDEVYTCQINALWKAIKNFDSTKKTKFTTYLYTGVMIECIKAVKFVNKGSQASSLHDNMSLDTNDTIILDFLDEAENEIEYEILVHRSQRRTIEEIGSIMGSSRETIRKKIKKMEKRIRHKFTE